MTESPPTSDAVRRRRRSSTSRVATMRSVVVVLLLLVVAWEVYKLVGKSLGGTWPLTGIAMRPPPDDRSMPHVWDIVAAIFQPARRGGDPLWLVLGRSTLFTLREAAVGFVIGGAVGFGLGVAFVRSELAERTAMPYVVASQTIPILAIAPMVVIWGGRLSVPQWMSVSIIAAYLTFFPVTINTVRGLRSPSPTASELMTSYAASPRQMLWKLQVPAALPYIFTALKISAAASVIGAVVGELPAGFADGLGRALLSFSQQFTASPEKLYAAVLFSALAGIVFVSVIGVAEQRTLAGARPAASEDVAGRMTGRFHQ